jgi:hypothetical protein
MQASVIEAWPFVYSLESRGQITSKAGRSRKDADPDIPILKQAKAEYVKL